MAFFIVLGLLIIAAFIIVIIQRNKSRVGAAWIIALIASSLAWLVLFFLRLLLPLSLELLSWSPVELFQGTIGLTLDYFSWPYAIAVMTLCIAGIFTQTTLISDKESTPQWVAALTLTALTLISLASNNALTLAITWSIIDLTEFFYEIRRSDPHKKQGRVMRVFVVRILSTFTLIFATSVAWQVQPNFDLNQIPSSAGIFFLIAAGLRLGVLPIHLPFTASDDESHQTAFGFRLAPVASALTLIAHLPEDFLTINRTLFIIIQILNLIAMLYASMMWVSKKTDVEAQPYWIVALSAFALQCALNGQAANSRVWGLALLLCGGLLFAFKPPIRRIRFLPALGLIGLVGLPYTLLASGWQSVLGQNFSFMSVIVFISHSLLVLGYIRYVVEASGSVTGLEKHARVTFPLGLIFIFQTIVILGLIAWPGVLTLGVWWAGLVSIVITGLVILGLRVMGIQNLRADLPAKLPYYRIIAPVIRLLSAFFSLSWFYNALSWLYRKILRFESFGSQIIEGDGGLLWSLVFLLIIFLIFVSKAGGL